jgi:hypothetical protein
VTRNGRYGRLVLLEVLFSKNEPEIGNRSGIFGDYRKLVKMFDAPRPPDDEIDVHPFASARFGRRLFGTSASRIMTGSFFQYEVERAVEKRRP